MSAFGRGGSPALPLFDRLRAHGTEALPDAGSVLRASVVREIAALLNTRASRAPAGAAAPCGTLEYGLPDFSGFAIGHPESHERMARLIAQAITAFEPRLASPRVAIRAEAAPDALLVQVEGGIGGEDATLRFHLSRHAVRPDGG